MGLAGHYADQVRRIKEQAGAEWRSAYRPAMGVLAVARTALTARQLADYSGADREALDEVLEAIRLLLDQATTCPTACRPTAGTTAPSLAS